MQVLTCRTSLSWTMFGCPWHCLRRAISFEQSTLLETILTANSCWVDRQTHRRQTLKLPSPRIPSRKSISYFWKNTESQKGKGIKSSTGYDQNNGMNPSQLNFPVFQSIPLFRDSYLANKIKCSVVAIFSGILVNSGIPSSVVLVVSCIYNNFPFPLLSIFGTNFH